MTPTLTITEAELSEVVIDLAHLLGWACAHFRPARTEHGWRTPVAADATGWPDLVLVRTRVLYVELKSATGQLRPEQVWWKQRLEQAGAEWHLWAPADWRSGEIERLLRAKGATNG